MNAELSRDMIVIRCIALWWDSSMMWLLNKVWQILLLAMLDDQAKLSSALLNIGYSHPRTNHSPEVYGVFLCAKFKVSTLHIVTTARSFLSQFGHLEEAKYQSITHELAHPINGFSHRALPCKMSKSTLQTPVPDLPEELAVLEGLKIRTVLCRSSPMNYDRLATLQ